MKPVALRIAGEVGGTVSFLAAIVHLPLANTAAIFQALPLAITLGAALIFAEPVGWRRWSAIMAGFIGVLIIVRPGLEGFNQFSLFALVAVVFCALRDLATKRIPGRSRRCSSRLLTTVTVTAAGAAILFPLGGWTPLTGRGIGLLALAAVLLLIGYQTVIMALRSGDISAVAPFRYSALLWAMLLGYLVFGDVPDAMMVTGARSSCCPVSTPSIASASVTATAGGGKHIRLAARRVVIVCAKTQTGLPVYGIDAVRPPSTGIACPLT